MMREPTQMNTSENIAGSDKKGLLMKYHNVEDIFCGIST